MENCEAIKTEEKEEAENTKTEAVEVNDIKAETTTTTEVKQQQKQENINSKENSENLNNKDFENSIKTNCIPMAEGASNNTTEVMDVDNKKPAAVIAAQKRPLDNIIDNFEADEQYQYIKRRKIKVAGAPKMPLTGYVRYMNDRRETLRNNFPKKTALEHTRMIAEEWSQLSEEKKTPYTKAADEDKKRYLTELNNFLRENPDVLASELAKNKNKKPAGENKGHSKEKGQANANSNTAASHKVNKDVGKNGMSGAPIVHNVMEDKNKQNSVPQKRKRSPTPSGLASGHDDMPSNLAANIVTHTPGEIPIFTTEFLEHNKNADANLKILRKSKADLEQQNAVLEKHVENMKTGVAKMAVENNELQEKNRLLEIYLNKLKQKLAKALSGLSIPEQPNGATVENIEKYMENLYKMSSSNTANLNKAKDIVRKLDLEIQL